ncbi:MAG: very short patch repair endonuclease [Paracoccaceae bacterium]
MDRISPEQRSRNMSRITGRDTKPEIRLRSALHREGLRFRVCRNDLPGRPDIVFPRQKLAIQVRGCFWHQHSGCKAGRIPGSNLEYWKPKLEANVKRDAEKDTELRSLGWQVLVFWECEIRNDGLIEKIVRDVKAQLHAFSTENNGAPLSRNI